MNRCSTNMAQIHLLAGDYASAYRELLPAAEAGDAESIRAMIEVCERAGDRQRAAQWRALTDQRS